MNKAKFYEVFDFDTGKLLVSGDIHSCAMALGYKNENSLYSVIFDIRRGVPKNYIITQDARIVYPEYRSNDEYTEKIKMKMRDYEEAPAPNRPAKGLTLEDAKKWDDICSPIREKYGIPIYDPLRKKTAPATNTLILCANCQYCLADSSRQGKYAYLCTRNTFPEETSLLDFCSKGELL